MVPELRALNQPEHTGAIDHPRAPGNILVIGQTIAAMLLPPAGRRAGRALRRGQVVWVSHDIVPQGLDQGCIVGLARDLELAALLIGRRVRQVALVNDCHDLRVEFDQGMILETFADSEQYEHWHVGGGPDEMIIAGPGKLWSSF
jgi:hypothetical protein